MTTSLPLHPVPPGDIAALQNMPLKELVLYNCKELTGKPAVRVGQISKSVALRATLDRFQERSSK